jgi:hypothetical protein
VSLLGQPQWSCSLICGTKTRREFSQSSCTRPSVPDFVPGQLQFRAYFPVHLKGSGNQIGSLAAARNLHIVDVYDADANGKQHCSLGSVLYVEVRSLVFYSYDLDDHKQFKSNGKR